MSDGLIINLQASAVWPVVSPIQKGSHCTLMYYTIQLIMSRRDILRLNLSSGYSTHNCFKHIEIANYM